MARSIVPIRRIAHPRSAMFAAVTAAVVALAGCQGARPRVEALEPMTLPDRFRNADDENAPDRARVGLLSDDVKRNADAIAEGRWWRVFGSSELDGLVDRALANNRDLRIATLQIAQAKIRADQVVADGKPRITAPLQLGLQVPGGQVGAVPISRSSSDPQASYQASIRGSWQPDIWGERQGMTESADLQVLRALYERENVQRNTIAALVTAYINYLAANDAIRLLRESEATERVLSILLEERLAAGDATVDELERRRVSLNTLVLGLPALEQQREEARSTIAYLVGAVPGDLDLSAGSLDALAPPRSVEALPIMLLFQRPDIRAVEARIRAASADIEVMRARMMPALSLTAQSGLSSLVLSQLVSPQSFFWNVIPSLALTLFDGGRRDADRALSQATYEEMLETYGRTVLQAVREVEGALAGLRAARDHYHAQQRVTRAGLGLLQVSESGFGVGSVDRSMLLEAKKNYQRYLEDERKREADLLRAHVTLHQALGAGASWSPDEEVRVLARASDTELYLGDRGQVMPTAGFQVVLGGIHHQSAVPAVWRDLNVRHTAVMQGRGLRVRRSGIAEWPGGRPQTWHQLGITRFESRHEAETFCRALQRAQQTCSVEGPMSEGGRWDDRVGRIDAPQRSTASPR